MSPGRASSALTILRPLAPCWALCTHVATPAQPPPGILCPACSSDQVTNDAHHGFPGGTPAAARYWFTCGPMFAPPTSRTPRWVSAMWSAAAPGEPPPPPAEAAAASTTAPGGAAAAEATGAAGCGWTALRNICEPALLASAFAAWALGSSAWRKDCESLGPAGGATGTPAGGATPGVTAAALANGAAAPAGAGASPGGRPVGA